MDIRNPDGSHGWKHHAGIYGKCVKRGHLWNVSGTDHSSGKKTQGSMSVSYTHLDVYKRQLYDITHSTLKKVHTSMVTMTKDNVKVEPLETHKYLFTTSTCPNCRMAKKMLEGEELEIIDAEKNPELARQFGIMQAPTLVITDGEHLKKYVNASNIQRYVDEEL